MWTLTGTPISVVLHTPRTLGPGDLILSVSVHATEVAGGDRLGVGGGPGEVSSRRWAWRGVYRGGDPGWWYHEAKGKGSIPNAATPIYKYIADLEYVA